MGSWMPISGIPVAPLRSEASRVAAPHVLVEASIARVPWPTVEPTPVCAVWLKVEHHSQKLHRGGTHSTTRWVSQHGNDVFGLCVLSRQNMSFLWNMIVILTIQFCVVVSVTMIPDGAIAKSDVDQFDPINYQRQLLVRNFTRMFGNGRCNTSRPWKSEVQ